MYNATSNTNGPTILLVDDDRDILHGLGNTLTRAGYKVVTASGGHEALSAFKASFPSIMILDLMLPVKDGMEVCREIRKKCDVPILMLTARDDSIDKILGLELGADDYVTKPFKICRWRKYTLPGTVGWLMGRLL
jgi:two-component system response regulator VicR